jgi:hypothetical protein
MTNLVSFTRRWNRDSLIDSICTKCYRTISSANKEDKLGIREKNHVCDPYEQVIRPDADSHQDGKRSGHASPATRQRCSAINL